MAIVSSSQHPLRKGVEGVQSWARKEGSGAWGELGGGQYDQNTLYAFLKEIITFFKAKKLVNKKTTHTHN